MIEVRIHGRGGQGAVTCAELMAKAAGLDGKHAQAFPAFGVERRGAPVRSFCRISERPITIRSQVYSPDYVVVLDPTLLGLPEVSEGKKEDSVLIMNSENPRNMGFKKAYSYNATGKALEVLGRDIVNTAMLGVFSKSTGLVTLESLLEALGERFSGKLFELNKKLVEEAYGGVSG